MNAPSVEITDSGLCTDGVAPTAAGLYRLYDQRWVGVFAMVSPIFSSTRGEMFKLDGQFMLEAVSAASWPWFGPISNKGMRSWFSTPRTLLIYVQLFVISGSL
jgi:hypothetical protein